jgi:catechol 2,3-dioxygenase-like lactoylglutathione lyase family enzyme
MEYQLQSYSEFVLSVSNLSAVSDFFVNYGDWEKVYEGIADASQINFWQLPPQCYLEEVLLQFMGNPQGQIRLVKFNQVAQRQIRSGSQVWDTGGIMDIDIRVSNINQVYYEMEALGWQGISEPVAQTMGPFAVNEVLMKGFDGIVIALVNRLVPPLSLPENKKLASNIYLSALIVKDLALASDFFVRQLGFQIMNEIAFTKDSAGENMFGLPHNLANQVTAHLQIISPNGSRDTMLDILQFEGVSGKDCAAYAQVPNLGILLVRNPVKNLENYYQFVQKQGIKPLIPLSEINLLPYGKVKIFAVQSPDGVCLEFYETLDSF